MTVALGEPDADNDRFPLLLQHNGKSWSTWWTYKNRIIARDFYQTRAYLRAEGLFQIEETEKLSPKLTAARVTDPGTKETREFGLETPRIFTEIDQFNKIEVEEIIAQATNKKPEKILTLKEIGKDGRFIAHDDGTVLDTRTGLMWAAQDNGSDINWRGAKGYCGNYRGGGFKDWRMPTQDELAGLYDKAKSVKSSACGDTVHLTELIWLSCFAPWASETRGSEWAHYFDFRNGKWGLTSPIGILYKRALPVRSGK
jgi:hypothetical protein